jgi:hypothetical protein
MFAKPERVYAMTLGENGGFNEADSVPFATDSEYKALFL